MLGGSNTRWLLFNGGSNDIDTPQNACAVAMVARTYCLSGRMFTVRKFNETNLA